MKIIIEYNKILCLLIITKQSIITNKEVKKQDQMELQAHQIKEEYPAGALSNKLTKTEKGDKTEEYGCLRPKHLHYPDEAYRAYHVRSDLGRYNQYLTNTQTFSQAQSFNRLYQRKSNENNYKNEEFLQDKFDRLLLALHSRDMKRNVRHYKSTIALLSTIITWINQEREIFGLPEIDEYIKSICEEIINRFDFNQSNIITFIIYTCFLNKSFVLLKHKAFDSTEDILIIRDMKSLINAYHVFKAVEIWKGLNIHFETILEGYIELVRVRRIINPDWDSIVTESFDISFKANMQKGLKFFFK